MAPAVNEICSGVNNWGSSWDDFNRLHQRLLTDFHRDFFTSSFDNEVASTSKKDSVQINNEKDKFVVIVDSKDFKPEELKVSTFDNVLKIEGKHIEETSSSSSPGNESNKYVSRQFSRSYTLPSDCKVHDMASSFGSGKLTVTVPKSRPAIEEVVQEDSARSVPIAVQRKSSEAKPSVEPSVRQVTISHKEKKEERREESSKSPEPPVMTSSVFDMDRGSSLFHRWVRPIQLFDEDFFEDSFWQPHGGCLADNTSIIRSSVGSKVQVNDNDERFEFIVPTDDYQPQELKVTVLDDVLKIEGKHVSGGEGDVTGKKVSKQFSRSYVLPKHVYKMDQVESCLTKAKNLVVKVPKIQPKTNEVNVPIKML